jgi:NADP-dependent 3-hydroxy acid dehydrogenase YdfG
LESVVVFLRLTNTQSLLLTHTTNIPLQTISDVVSKRYGVLLHEWFTNLESVTLYQGESQARGAKMELKEKIALITGASSGIGEATARALSLAGAKVVLVARRKDRLETLRQELQQKDRPALVVTADVTKKSDVSKAVGECLNTFGRIDILVNNAGIMPLSYVKNLKEDEWERMVDVNIKGVLYGIGAVLPAMIKQSSGHIVNISSVAGRRVFAGGAVYCATKFAVAALSEGLRMELSAEHKIRVTTIEPGFVATELPSTITDTEFQSNVFPSFAKVRPLMADDIARAILYAVTQPPYVDVAEILVMPSTQQM